MLKNAAKLWPIVRPHRWPLAFVLLTGFFVAIFANILPLLLQLLVQCFEKKDILATNKIFAHILSTFFDLDKLRPLFADHFLIVKTIAVIFPFYFLILGLFRYINAFQSRYIAEQIGNELRYSIMSRLLSLSPSYYSNSKTGSGSLISRTLNDTAAIQHGMSQYVDLLREPLVAIVALTYMFYANLKLTLFCMIFAPIIAVIVNKLSKKLKALSLDSQSSMDVVAKNLKEGIDGIRVIQSYNDEENMRLKFRQSIDNYTATRKKVIKRAELASPLNEFIVSFLAAGACYLIGTMIFSGEMDLGHFMGFLVAAGNLDKPVKKIQQALVAVSQTDASVQRLFEIIESTEVVQEPAPQDCVPFPHNWSTIEFKNVSFKYKSDTILDSINLKVRRGEIIALVGESGSGKSTLVNLLERFFDPNQGEILIDGINISKFSLKELRSQIALVTQDVFLFNESLAENISSHQPHASLEKIKDAAQKANAIKFIEKLDSQFDTVAGERGSNFSGGEKQRISIARAIYKDAPILILDEATSALDSASEADVQKGINSLMAGRTAFIIAHRLSTISRADRILVMKSGKIVEEGTHQELLDLKGIYHHYQTIQEG